MDKPAGLLTAAAPGHAGPNVFDFLKERHKAGGGRRRGPRGERIWIIHRLDKEASGLLVFAKTERAFDWLKEEFRTRRVHRLYVAVVEGEVRSEDGRPVAGTIQSFIDDEGATVRSVGVGEALRHRARPRRAAEGEPPTAPPRRLRRPGEGGPKLAVTHYRVVAAGQGRSLVQLRLETGRRNQIRVHMREWGHPIVGDRRYGAQSDPLGRLALHAVELGFADPRTGQTLRFRSPAPRSFYTAVGATPPGAAEAEQAPEAPPAPPPVVAMERTSWDHVAAWYDELLEKRQSDHYERVILPGVLRLLEPRVGQRVLDVACGQGALCRRLAELGVEATGVDASPRLIEAARRREERAEARPRVRYEVGDARDLGALARAIGRDFDAATCVMALMNIEPLEPVIQGCAGLLREGGAFIAVILHPAFRAPGQTSWGWESEGQGRTPRTGGRAARVRQYRRVEGYLSPGQTPITMNPGQAAHGADPVVTWTFHRPIQTYVRALARAGLLLDALEEWPSLRTSEPGPRAAEENRARREIPMFLALRALKIVAPSEPRERE